MHGELVPVPRSALDTTGVLAPAARSARIGLGLAGLVARGAYVAVAGRPRQDAAAERGPALWAGAALGLAMEVERRVVHTAESVLAAGSAAARGVSRLPLVHGPTSRFDAWLVRWNAHARTEQRLNRAEAQLVMRRVVRQVTDAVLAHVDFVHIVDQIPMNEIVDALLEQVDFVHIVEQIPVKDIVDKLDVAALVNGAMTEIDLGGLIRESTEGVTAEAVDVVRSQTVKTDLFVSRVVDRVLFRKAPRDLTVEGTTPTEPPDGHGP